MAVPDPNRQLIIDALKLSDAAHTPVRGAAFKARFLQILSPGLDLRAQGYPTLRAFLEAYPDVVAVEHDGIDLLVKPVEASAHVDALPQLKIIRPDLWRAFTLFDPRQLRYFDRDATEAVLLPRTPAADEPARYQNLRRRLNDGAQALVPITPVSSDEQMGEMRGFIKTLADGPLRLELETALAKPQWFREFMTTLHARPPSHNAWRIRWSEYVFARIELWMKAHSVSISNLVLHTTRAPAETTRPRPASASGSAHVPATTSRTHEGERRRPDVEAVRAQALRAVERMTLSQLLALPIPLEFTVIE